MLNPSRNGNGSTVAGGGALVFCYYMLSAFEFMTRSHLLPWNS